MQQVRVGVGVFIRKNGKILLGKRKNAHGDGAWGLPGGHLEFNESIEDCARREVLEETGLEIQDVQLGPYTNDIFEQDKKHYITIYGLADTDAEPKLMEPDKFERLEWYSWDALPQPLFIPVENLKATGYNPFD